MSPSIDVILRRKREGEAHTEEEIRSFVSMVVDRTITDAQIGAWLTSAFIRGLGPQETLWLTDAMMRSGVRLDWAGLEGPFIDKHSTGGIGDKVSLVLAPLWAELGLRVPMISGRSLGHTGGTLDKMEAIPGYRCDLPQERLRQVLAEVGCFINGQTGELAPADRVLYARRDETQTVASVSLITASILCKKLVEGLDELVMDVKVGSGAFMKDLDAARALATSLVRVGNLYGVKTRALLTDMSQPLGFTAGNFIEVQEAVNCLKGGGPPDLRDEVVRFAGHPRAAEVLASGAAYDRFRRMVVAHGGDVDCLEHRGIPTGAGVVGVWADRTGFVQVCDALEVGMAALRLGAARIRSTDAVRPEVGVILHHKRGAEVRSGDLLAEVVHVGVGVEEAVDHVRRAFLIGDQEPTRVPLVLEEIGPDDV